MGKLKRAVTAYVLASGAVALPAAFVTWWPRWVLDWQTAPFHFIYPPIWMFVVGLPSMWAAGDEVARVLGKKPKLEVATTNQRRVPIFTEAVGILPWAIPAPQTPTVDIADEFCFSFDGTTVYSNELQHFLYKAWRRQRRGNPPLSRNWWVKGGRIERCEYETIAMLLVTHNLLKNRRQGASGKLRFPPIKTMSELRHRYG